MNFGKTMCFSVQKNSQIFFNNLYDTNIMFRLVLIDLFSY